MTQGAVTAQAATYSSTVMSNSPLSYYRLSEAGGPTAIDSSSQGNNGTYSSSGITYSVAGAVSGDSDHAISAAGSGGAVTASASSLPSTTLPRTIEVWFKSGVADLYLVSYGNLNLRLYSATTHVQWDDSNGTHDMAAPYTLGDNNWHLVDLASGGGNTDVFVDGQLIRSSAGDIDSVAGSSLSIGSGFVGSLDEVAIYGTRLSASEVNARWTLGDAVACPSAPTSGYAGSIVSTDHPLRYYRLGETGGRVAADYSGNCLAGAYAYPPSATHTAGALIGESDGALAAATAGSAAVSGSIIGLPLGARTVEAWVNTGIGDGYIVSYGNFNLRLYAATRSVQWDDSGGSQAAATHYPLGDGNWHLIDLASDGAETRTYVDGQLLDTKGFGITSTASSGLSIGGAISGAIDEVAIYGGALAPDRVNAHWRSGSSASCPAAPSGGYAGAVVADGAFRYFRLGESAGSRVAADFSGNCRGAAYNYGTTHTLGGLLSSTDGAAGAPPSNDTMVSASGDDFPIGSSAWSMEAWVKTTVHDSTVLSYGNFWLDIYCATGCLQFATGGGGQVSTVTPYTLGDGGWHYVVFTADPAAVQTAHLYLDSIEIFAGSPSMATAAGQGLRVGKGPQDPPTQIDEFAIYKKAIDQDTVSRHYFLGAPVGGPLSVGDGRGLKNCGICQAIEAAKHAVAHPIDTSNGNMEHDFVDVSIPGRSRPLGITRTYNSTSAAVNGPMGYGWSTGLAMSVSCSGNTATVTQENGATATFTTAGSCSTGSWVPAAPRYTATLDHNPDGSWLFVRQAKEKIKFDASGALTEIRDLNDYVTSFSYTSGQVTSISDEASRSLALTWSGGHVTRVTDANITPSRSVDYQYDGAGNLTDVYDLNGGHWRFGYDVNHRMTSMQDPNCVAAGSACNGGNGVQTHYDGSGRADWQKDQLGQQTTLDYQSIPGATKITDPASHVTVDSFNSGIRVAETRGFGSTDEATWRYAFDTKTLALIATLDPNGHATFAEVDDRGNPVLVTDGIGRQTQRTFNALDEALTVKDGNLVTTTFTYDARGNLSTASTPLAGTSQVQTTAYNRTDTAHPGDVTAMVDPDLKTWPYSYDANGYRASVSDPRGDKTTTTYNAIGWPVSGVSPKGNVAGCGCATQYTTAYGYDDAVTGRNNFGDPISVTDPLSHSLTKHYDADRNVDKVTDADGNVTSYVYDLANKLTQTKRADSPQTTMTTDYNADGTVAAQKDGKSNTIERYIYDGQGRRVSTSDALLNVTGMAYDAAGNAIKTQQPGGNCAAVPSTGCISRTFDSANELTAVSFSDGTTPNISNVTYDGDGQRTAMTDGTGSSSWVWDSLHRITSHTNGAGSQVQYKYNLRNLVTNIAYPGGSCGASPVLCVTRAYDDAGRWTSVQDWETNTTAFGYDANSNLTSTTTTFPWGVTTTDTTTVDDANRVMSMSAQSGPSALSPFPSSYARDGNNQLTSDSSAVSAQDQYQYSALNQVCYAGSAAASGCAAPPAGSQPFSYDAADNLTKLGSQTQQFNAANQLCWTVSAASSNACDSAPAGATAFAYDSRGNRTAVTPTSGPATCNGYDQADRLISIQTGTGASCTTPSSVGTYVYDGGGLRMSKTVAGITTRFAWDVSAGLPLLLQEQVGSGEPVRYIYGPGGMVLEQLSRPSGIRQVGTLAVLADKTGATASAPIPLPSGIQRGDQIIVAATFPAGVNNDVSISGYTSVGSVTNPGGLPTADVTKVFKRTAVAGDTSVPINYIGSFPRAAEAAVYRGVDPRNPIDVWQSGASQSTANTVSASAVTTNQNDQILIIQGATYTSNKTGVWTAPSGATEQPTGDAKTVSIGLADLPQEAVGSTGNLDLHLHR